MNRRYTDKLHRAAPFHISPQRIVHAGLPAFAGRAKELHDLGAVAHRYRNLGGFLLWATLAGQANLALRPERVHRGGVIGIIRASRILHFVGRSCNGCGQLPFAKGEGRGL